MAFCAIRSPPARWSDQRLLTLVVLGSCVVGVVSGWVLSIVGARLLIVVADRPPSWQLMATTVKQLALPGKSTVLQLQKLMKVQGPAHTSDGLRDAWDRLAEYLSRVGLQRSPVYFSPYKPQVYQAHLVLRSPFLLQTDRPASGLAPRSRDGKGRRLTAAQNAEQTLARKVLGLLQPSSHVSGHQEAVVVPVAPGPRTLPLPALPSPQYSSAKDELYGVCKRLGVTMPLFYAYAVSDRPKLCMAIVSCEALARIESNVIVRGLRSNSAEESLLDLAEMALYSLKKVQLDELLLARAGISRKDVYRASDSETSASTGDVATTV